MNAFPALTRRNFLFGAGAAGLTALPGCSARSQTPLDRRGEVVSVRDFGAVSAPGHDNTAAIQRAVEAVVERGGGVVHIPEVYECGHIIVRGDGVTFYGPGAWLVNARITIQNHRQDCHIEGLGIIDRRRDEATYLLDIGGHNCTFKDFKLVKDPIVGGYQAYVRQTALNCRFTGFEIRGSNGIMVAGSGHEFADFRMQSTLVPEFGGDDAFAIKGLGGQSENITIRNGTVAGFSAIASIGSEVGTQERDSNYTAFVRNVTVRDIRADRCALLAFIKPGALIYDWRNGLVEGVELSNLSLEDPTGFKYICGVMITAGRGAIVRGVRGRGLTVRARARSQDVLATSAIDLNIIREGAPARIENVDLQLDFADPHDGAPHSPAAPGYPVDHVVRIEKLNPAHGAMANIDLDVTGRGTRMGGIFVGAGLDGAVRLRRAHLRRIAVNPPSSLGAGGIWSDSRLRLEDVRLDEVMNNSRFGGRGLPR